MQLGARIIKSGLAVILALYIAELLHMSSLTFVGIASFLAVQPSVYRSWKHFFLQLLANIIGAIVAISFVYLFGNSPIIVGLAVILLLSVHVSLKQFDTLSISVLTVIAMMEVQNQDFTSFATERFTSISVGIICAVLINILFFPPKYESKLIVLIQTVSEQSSTMMRNLVLNQLTQEAVKSTLENMVDNNKKIDELFQLHLDHFKNRFHRHKLSEKKRTVIFREMTKVLKKEEILINAFKEHRKELESLDGEMLNDIQQHLYLLTNYEEKIFLKFKNQVQPGFPCDLHKRVEKSTFHLLSFLENHQESYRSKKSEKIKYSYKETQMPFLILFSTIFELGEQLIRLDKFVDNFAKQKAKKEKNKKNKKKKK